MVDLETLYAKLQEITGLGDAPLDPQTVLHTIGTSETKEEITDSELKDKYLTPSDQLPWNLLNEFYEAPKLTGTSQNDINFSLLETPSLVNRTSIRFKRSGIDCAIVSHSEEFLNSDALDTGSSLSFNRKFDRSAKVNVKGSTSNLPFMPGGLSDKNGPKTSNSATKFLHKDPYGLYDIPQGFSRGLNEVGEGSNIDIVNEDKVSEELDLLTEGIDDIALNEQRDSEESTTTDDTTATNINTNEPTADPNLENEISQFIPSSTIIKPSAAVSSLHQQQKRKTNWAHVVDLDHKIENFDELIPNPARTWPFELDIFQQEAVYHLEQGDSVFVAAHTSAGKTVVAEYAIAMAHNNMTKAIYTSPIKALSNQKFRDFKHTFKEIDVGVITGDVQINPEANCLIMTTEILRSMLYRGSDVIRDVEFVIFDEVHYVNDVDRGVVWEEVIIMLPDHVKIILLSATVPNTLEFASWVGRTKQKDIYVISTPKRPVPLEIFLFAKDTPFKIIDSNRKFLESGYMQHEDKFTKGKPNDKTVATRGGSGGQRGGSAQRGGRGGGRGGTVQRGGRGGGRGGSSSGNSGPRFIKRDAPTSKSWTTLVDYLRKNDLLPAVIFVFSKKRCEEYAETLSGFNFSNARESSEIHMFIDKAVSRLKKEDRELPQILRMREMLKRGIAVHHGGLLPIIKEVVEILFSKSLIKVLFATETFAMGLNLPTRTVVFSSLRKHDGNNFRDLLPGEFTQMSGRAGRRGLDKIGTVMIMAYQQAADKNSLKQVALGVPTKLSSQFRLTYTMILNLLRIEALRVEDMIKRSFGENTSQSMLPEQQLEIIKLEKELAAIPNDIATDSHKEIEELALSTMEFKELTNQVALALGNNRRAQKFLQFGRVIVFRDPMGVPTVGIIMTNSAYKNTIECIIACQVPEQEMYKIERLRKTNLVFDPSFGHDFIEEWFPRWEVFQRKRLFSTRVKLESIEFISQEFIEVGKGVINKDPKSISRFLSDLENILHNRCNWREMSIHPFMNESNVEVLTQYVSKLKTLSPLFHDFELTAKMKNKDNFVKISEKLNLTKRIDDLKHSLSDENLELLPEYNKRLDVLKTLDYVNPEQLTINLKGRVACEVNCGWELIITELVFENFLGGFSSEEIVALLSCFVYDGKKGDGEEKTKLQTPRLEKGKDKIVSIVERIMTLSSQMEIQLTAEEESFLEIDRFALVNTVYEWARGRSFKDIMEYANDADESEGTIVRVITFLDEICNQVKNAALITGDSALHSKMTDAQEKIKRDIVFCASLYL
jgi:antiviral helicase SKI2